MLAPYRQTAASLMGHGHSLGVVGVGVRHVRVRFVHSMAAYTVITTMSKRTVRMACGLKLTK
jgi:hypothetical protein